MRNFDATKYEGSKYDYNGNIYEFGGLEEIDKCAYKYAYVVIYNVNDDTFVSILPRKFEDFHRKYVIK